jgi:pimeloyl-ACP methyl ester carboxylesterase
MAKMSQNVKEIIQVVAFVVVVVGLILVFVTYPLTRSKTYLGRTDLDTYQADSVKPNDVSAFLGLDAAVDTFRIDADGLTELTCVYLAPRLAPDSLNQQVPPRGTAVLVHGDGAERTSMVALAGALIDSGWAVCLYDQRASGLSSGTYRSDGEFEGGDLNEVLAYLRIRDRLIRPLAAVGIQTGADAALLSAAEKDHFDAVVAIQPYLTSERWLDLIMKNRGMYWIPFPHTVFKFWYELRSGYAPQYRDLQSMRPPLGRVLLLDWPENLAEQTVTAYLKLVGPDKISAAALPSDKAVLQETVIRFLMLDRGRR